MLFSMSQSGDKHAVIKEPSKRIVTANARATDTCCRPRDIRQWILVEQRRFCQSGRNIRGRFNRGYGRRLGFQHKFVSAVPLATGQRRKKRTPMLVIMTYGLRNLLPRSLRSPQKLSRTGLNTHQMPSATGFSDFLGLWYCSGNQFEAHLEIQSPRLPTGNMIEGILPVGSMSS